MIDTQAKRDELERNRDQALNRAENQGAQKHLLASTGEDGQQKVDLEHRGCVKGKFQQKNLANAFLDGRLANRNTLSSASRTAACVRKRLSNRGWLFKSHQTASRETMAIEPSASVIVSAALVGR